MYSLDKSLTKAGGTVAWSKTLQGELQELRNTWDPLQRVALLGDISGSSFQTSKRLVDVVSRIWALAFGMFEDVSLKMFQV